MKVILLLSSLMVLLQIVTAAAPKKGSFVDHCIEYEKAEKDKADKAKVDQDKADKKKAGYSEADKQGKKFERESVKKAKTSIPQLGKDLAAPFTDPLFKARAIFAWLHHYVVFDSVPNSTRRSPGEVIIRGIAVGQDYAKLFEELAIGVGLEVMYILGHGKGPGYEQPPPGNLPFKDFDHAWNAVKMNGKWQLIDPSYGARVTKTSEKKYGKPLYSTWFESTPEAFGLTHYPEKPEHQFCSDVISWKDYIFPPSTTPAPPTMPARLAGANVSGSFRQLGFDDNHLTPNVRSLPVGEPVQFVVKSQCEKPPIKKEDRYLLFIDDSGVTTPLTMEVEGRVWSAATTPDPGTLRLFAIHSVKGRDAKALTLEEYETAANQTTNILMYIIATWEVAEQDIQTDMMEVTHSNDSDVSDFTCIDYTKADAQGAKFPPETFKSIRKLAKDLTSPFTSQALKAKAIFAWITTNIAYDDNLVSEGIFPKSAEKVVRTGLGTCQQYSKLFKELAKCAGLDVLYIRGTAKGPGYNPPKNGVVQPETNNHMWNAVKLNGRWKIVDCTWGAGRKLRNGKISGSGFHSKWFTASPEVFRGSHFPEKPEEQFCSDVMTWDEFCLQENKGPWINGINDGGLNLQEVKPRLKRIPAGKPVKFEAKCKCGPIKPEDQYLFYIRVNTSWSHFPKVDEDGCLWSIVLTPLEGQEVSLVYISEFGTQPVKGLTRKQYQNPPPGTRGKAETLAKWEA